MKPYPSYKDSGIKYLGVIPKHWEIYKLAHVVSKISNGFVGITSGIMVNSGVPYIQGIHIKNNTIKFTPTGDYYVSESWSNEHKKSVLEEDDILIVQTGTIGEVAIVPKEFHSANCHALIILRSITSIVYPRFLLWSLASDFGKNSFYSIKTGEILLHLNSTRVNGLKIPIPLLSEQTQIARYLDYKTQQIDDLIAKKERLIELLKEERIAIINHAVTKGLDPNVPMKDSGIEWLGEIPEHWSIVKLSYVVKIKDGTHDTPKPVEVNIDKCFPLITSKNIKSNKIDFNNVYYISEFDHENIKKRSEVNINDIIMPMIGTVGNPVIVNTEIEFSIKNLALFKYSDMVHNEFLCHFLDSWVTNTQFDLFQRGGVQNFVSLEILRSLKLLYPPMAEQKKVAEYLNMKLCEVEKSLSIIINEIDLLIEYKTSIINEVVTGKVDVRDNDIAVLESAES